MRNKEQIYVVDDNEWVCRSLQGLLVAAGFEVRAFFSAEEFFSAVPNSAEGCLILDLNMPGLNGWEAQRRLMKVGAKRPVIVMAEDKDTGIEELALKAGAVGFLQKPFDDRALIDAVNRALKSETSTKK